MYLFVKFLVLSVAVVTLIGSIANRVDDAVTKPSSDGGGPVLSFVINPKAKVRVSLKFSKPLCSFVSFFYFRSHVVNRLTRFRK